MTRREDESNGSEDFLGLDLVEYTSLDGLGRLEAEREMRGMPFNDLEDILWVTRLHEQEAILEELDPGINSERLIVEH